MSALIKFCKLPVQKKILLFEAIILLGIVRLIMVTVSFKRIAPYLGQYMQESAADSNAEEMLAIKKVSWAVHTMSRYTFWESKCLVQAITAKYMLRRRGIKSTLYLGVARDEGKDMIAHAWLRSGKEIVTGAQGRKRFVMVSSFGDTE